MVGTDRLPAPVPEPVTPPGNGLLKKVHELAPSEHRPSNVKSDNALKMHLRCADECALLGVEKVASILIHKSHKRGGQGTGQGELDGVTWVPSRWAGQRRESWTVHWEDARKTRRARAAVVL